MNWIKIWKNIDKNFLSFIDFLTPPLTKRNIPVTYALSQYVRDIFLAIFQTLSADALTPSCNQADQHPTPFFD